MRTSPEHDLDEVLAAVERGNNITGTAKVLGCCYQTVVNYSKRWRSVEDALNSKRKQMVDMGEGGLWRALERDDPWAIQFVLKTQGKDLGYVERQESTGKDGEPLFKTYKEALVDAVVNGE